MNVMQVSIILDGYQEIKVKLKFCGLIVRRTSPTCLLIGHAIPMKSKLSSAWYLGSVMLFRHPIFTKEMALYMLGLGPNYNCLADCTSDKQVPNFSNVIGPKTLSCGISWDKILDVQKNIINGLQEQLLMTYSAHNAKIINFYPQVVLAAPGSLFFSQLPGGYRIQSPDQRASHPIPLTLTPTLMAKLNTQQYQGLVAAATIIGGTPIFLFLFARIVELSDKEYIQAKALYILLKLVQNDSELLSQFVTQDTHKLLLQLLATKKCLAGHHILKVILETCCDKPVLQFHPGPGEFQVISRSDAIIVNSSLLSTIVGSWSAWEREKKGGEVLSTLFSTLHVLLRDDHPYRDFNATQLNRVDMIEALLLFCKERFLYEEWLQMPATVCSSLVELIRSLMGAPPEFRHIVSIMDCLLLLHQANCTYVTHARVNFYYLLAKIPTDTSVIRSRRISITNSLSSIGEKIEGTHLESKTISNSSSSANYGINNTGDSCSNSNAENEITDEKAHGEMAESDDKKQSTGQWDNTSSLNMVVKGFLLLMRDTLLVLPDNMTNQVVNHVITFEILLVMANHSDAGIRSSVVKVLVAHLRRCSGEEVTRFIRMKGFHLLANQLSLYPASLELVEACISLVTCYQISLGDQKEVFSSLQFSATQLNSFPPLLALLEMSIHDSVLAHSLLMFLREVFTSVMLAMRPLLECGLLEALMNTLVAVTHQHQVSSNIDGVSQQSLLIEDIQAFLIAILGIALRLPGGHQIQILSNMQLQLGYLQLQETVRLNSLTARSVVILRDTQCVIIEAALDIIQNKIFTFQPNINIYPDNQTTFLLATAYTYDAHSNCLPSKELSRGELTERFSIILVKAVEFLVNTESIICSSFIEQSFARRLFSTLLRAVGSVLERRSTAVMWGVKNTLRLQTAMLLIWMISPINLIQQRVFAVISLRGEPKLQELLTELLRNSPQMDQKFTLFLWDLVNNPTNSMQGPDKLSCEDLTTQLKDWGIIAPFVNSETWPDETQVHCYDMERHRLTWHRQNDRTMHLSTLRFEELVLSVSESAMAVTRKVVELQNVERKSYMEHIKAAFSEKVQIQMKWQKLIHQLTHERGVWHFPDSYPRSWELDPTEGPGRVRIRLQRCSLNVSQRFLLNRYQSSLKFTHEPCVLDPLSFLFENDNSSPTSSVLIERLHTNEKIQHMCEAKIVTPAREVSGELLIGESCLYFVDDDSQNVCDGLVESLDIWSTAWQFDSIKEVLKRRFQLKERALEIFLHNGRTYLVAFNSAEDRDAFVAVLSECSLPNHVVTNHFEDVKQLWREGVLTNWDYLNQLNKMAGRSYNDLMQYPVFPFVLSDYTSTTLDLTDPRIYRNFKKPMAVQDKNNEQHYINNFNYLKQELLEGSQLISLNQEPYHYGSHYSNSGTVLHFLVRLLPFTRMFLTYQDNNFDLPDRTFHSLHTTWRLASSDSTTDVKEMIPEFFFLPEFLLNSEGFNFGVCQNETEVDDVQLPSWCAGQARLFILVHRQALESAHVREHLPHWLDLVFGCKQTGKAAVDAINVFHPATYYGFNVESISDPLERSAWETMVRTYGQTPKQLLKVPHPMIIQALASHTAKTSVPDVMSGIKGLSWGNYVGSPSDPEPIVAWKHQNRNPIASFTALVTNDMFGLPEYSSFLVSYTKDKGLGYVNSTSILAAAQVTWGHADSVIRIKMKKDQIPWPIIKIPLLDPVCVCATTPECNQLWLGHLSGKILIYQYWFEPTKVMINFDTEAIVLLAHSDSVTTINLCRAFSIAVSGSADKSVIVWDLNKLSYVQTVQLPNPINLVCVSGTLGDIAIAMGYCLSYYTINLKLIGSTTFKECITALNFSNAPEGISVNVIACGLDNGKIRLLSTWNLMTVGELQTDFLTKPITCVGYSYDYQYLYAASSDGTMVIWERPAAKAANKHPKFVNLSSL